MMQPWEILDSLGDEPESVLKTLGQDDPFWFGASYAVDPFVGMIVRLTLSNPRHYGGGVSGAVFDKLVQVILAGELRGDQLALMVERFSTACTEPEWTRWYRPIFEGDLVLPFGLDLFNKYAGERIGSPALNKPRSVDPAGALAKRFFIQPAYPVSCFWLVNSEATPIEVRGYDEQVRRIKHASTEDLLVELARQRPMDVVLFGYLDDQFLVEDILTRDQFTRESVAYPLQRRLLAAAKLGLPLVQMSDELTGLDEAFWNELGLIFEQGYKGALIRDLDASYPFQVQPDIKVTASRFGKLVKARKLDGPHD